MAYLNEIITSNIGPISSLSWKGLGQINLLIGPNQSGKTFLLKAVFSALKTIEQYKRGKEYRSDKQILSDKLHWTFQTNNLGNIVKKGEPSLSFCMNGSLGQTFAFSFSKYAEIEAGIDKNTFNPRESNTVFIPAKEVISIKDIILEQGEEKSYGFDESYYDLAKALNRTQKGNNFKAFAEARQEVMKLVGGRLEYDTDKKEWLFRDKDRRIYEIGVMSEGVKKLSILDLLLGNRYLNNESVILIDEIEANLHPAMINKFLQMVFALSEAGVQFFIASHSYFVIKRLYVLAHQKNMSIPVLSFDKDSCFTSDLKDEMPNNPIIDESINIYREEINL